jgi:hypothetical protein
MAARQASKKQATSKPSKPTKAAAGSARPKAPTLDAVLGAPSRVRLLRVFCLADAPMTGREAARRAKVAHRASVLALGALVKAGVVRVKRGATRHEYRLETKHPLAKRLVRLFEREREG